MTSAIPDFLIRAGIAFRDPSLLTLALTHASRDRDLNNERLEFLGDRVLGLALAGILYVRYPDENEGALALRHAALVRAQVLADIARNVDLSKYLAVSAHDGASGTAGLENVLADALEALIGALYIDQGFDVCANLVLALWADTLAQMTLPPQDPKTALQEWAQARGLPLPAYEQIERTGPDHAPIFTLRAHIKNHGSADGTAPSRRAAEKIAAATLLATLKEKE